MKKKYLLELGGENAELGKFEALELLTTKKYEPELILDKGKIIALDVASDISKEIIRRLGMTRRISEIIHYLPERKIKHVLRNVPDIEIGDKSFAIRVIDGKKEGEGLISKKLGSKISAKNKIDLVNPDVKILYYSRESTIIAIWKKYNDTYYSKCLKHHVKHRPYFSPISIHPRIARAMVNFSNCTSKNSIIDPFCGTGGILIEIADMKIRAIGIDILKKMVEYSNGNLKHYKLEAEIMEGDIEQLLNYDFEGIVTDPPYGISTTTKGEDLKHLMKRSMNIFSRALVTGQRIVIAVSNPKVIKNPDFKVLYKFEWYIHKTLTKYIFVLEKS